jgi:CelD/BcsL family acetyltransferase involved in cellulose biosynthesis
VFGKYQKRWDQLNRNRGNHILLDAIFVQSLIRHFASDQALLGVCGDDGTQGMVILDRVRRGFWQTFQPSQGPLGLILLPDGSDVEGQMGDLMRSLPGYSLGLSVLQQDPEFTAFAHVKDSRTAELCDYAATSGMRLSGSFDEFWKGTGRYFVDDLRRQARRLEEKGFRIDFKAERDPRRVAACIHDYARLEMSGWKGRDGSAVTAEGPQGLFYREVLENFCREGEGIIYQLLFNGDVVASDLCLERDGMTVVLKIAYDESLQGISPGKFLHREMLKRLFEQPKAQVLEWYGRVNEWQRKLGSIPRMMFHVNFYRNEWVPMARDLAKRARGLIRQDNHENRNSPSGPTVG